VSFIAKNSRLHFFDGMNDVYEYSDEVWTDIFGGAKYVFENRVYTDELIKKLLSRQDTNKK